MGWADCGTDSKGRPIGYAFPATCDHPGCAEPIDRGLSYACGGMHGDDEISCERYFCPTHMTNWVERLDMGASGRVIRICDDCAKMLEQDGWVKDDEGCWVEPGRPKRNDARLKVRHVES